MALLARKSRVIQRVSPKMTPALSSNRIALRPSHGLIAIQQSAILSRSKAVSEICISTEVEADGPIPGPDSMLSFGSAAYTADKRLVSTFSSNLETLEGATPHPDRA